jgi:prephenate dehydrogenase
VAIIGAAGKMGSWFTNYFAWRGMHVYVYDINQKMLKKSPKVEICSTLLQCVQNADLVVVSVPIQKTPQTIKQCIKNMKNGSIIAEISSVKNKTFAALRRTPSTLRPLCIHPMFGPGASRKKEIKVLLVPVRDEKTEVKILHQMFENLNVVVLSNPLQHDKSIAIVLGLTYFVNIVFAKIMASGNFSMLKKVSGTTFGLQSLIAESVLIEEPDLIIALIGENKYAKKYANLYLKEAEALARLVVAKDKRYLLLSELQRAKSRMRKWQNLEYSYKLMYDTIEVFSHKRKKAE